MLARWQSAFASLVVSVLLIALIVLDVAVDAVRLWWDAHSFTVDVVSGLLVLAFTVLVCDQVLTLRQVRSRSTAIAAQAAIVMAQAARSAQAIKNLRAATEETDAAADAVQSFVFILSIATPVLIDTDLTRRFLEDAQRLAGAFGRALRDLSGDADAARWADDTRHLEHALGNLKDASAPLVDALSPDLRAAIAQDGATS